MWRSGEDPPLLRIHALAGFVHPCTSSPASDCRDAGDRATQDAKAESAPRSSSAFSVTFGANGSLPRGGGRRHRGRRPTSSSFRYSIPLNDAATDSVNAAGPCPRPAFGHRVQICTLCQVLTGFPTPTISAILISTTIASSMPSTWLHSTAFFLHIGRWTTLGRALIITIRRNQLSENTVRPIDSERCGQIGESKDSLDQHSESSSSNPEGSA